jgi:hypothetical protein
VQLKKGHLTKPSHLSRSEHPPPPSVDHARLPGEVADRRTLTGFPKGSLASAGARFILLATTHRHRDPVDPRLQRGRPFPSLRTFRGRSTLPLATSTTPALLGQRVDAPSRVSSGPLASAGARSIASAAHRHRDPIGRHLLHGRQRRRQGHSRPSHPHRSQSPQLPAGASGRSDPLTAAAAALLGKRAQLASSLPSGSLAPSGVDAPSGVGAPSLVSRSQELPEP